tara:strand:- start:4 stop:186 length:183 start_codon:yes stop_codon:yes gene_type:complete
MYYVTIKDEQDEGDVENFTSLFEATCYYYELLGEGIEPNELLELGEWGDEEEMLGLLFYP